MELFEKNVENYDNYTADDFLNEEEVKKIFSPVVVGEEHDTIMVLQLKALYLAKRDDDTFELTPEYIVFVRGTYKHIINGNDVILREFYCYEDKVRYFIDMVKQRGKIVYVSLSF